MNKSEEKKNYIVASRRLERLLNKSVKCPYCGNRIPKYSTTCAKCGISKAQIAEASSVEAKKILKRDERGKVVYTNLKPEDLSWRKLFFATLFGYFGLHCFITGRKVRGWVICGCMIAFIVFSLFIFPIGKVADPTYFSPVRESFANSGMIFPTDVFGTVAVLLWIWDWFAMLFGFFKYPVRLSERNKK